MESNPLYSEEDNKKRREIRPIVVSVLGFVFIVAGLIFNQWFFENLFIRYGHFYLSHKILIGMADVLLIFIGVLLIYYRNNSHMQMNIGLLIISLAVCLLLIEIILRLFLPLGKVNIQQRNILNIIQEGKNGAPYTAMPNLNIQVKLAGQLVTIDTNSLGMRWPEVNPNNPAGKKQIAFMGDSQTFGLWASTTDKTFVGTFASDISNKQFEVINFGVPGYSFFEMEQQIRTAIIPFAPSYVILVTYDANDIADTYAHDQYTIQNNEIVFNDKAFEQKISSGEKQSFSLQEASQENPILSFLKNVFVDLRNSYTYIFLNSVIQNTASKITAGKPIAFKVSSNFLSSTYWSQKQYSQPAKNAVAVSLEKLDSIRKFCNQNHIKLIVVALPFWDQVYADSLTGKDYDVRFPQQYIEDYSKEHQVAYLDLLMQLRDYVSSHQNASLYFQDNGHLNDLGHQVVGHLISDFFEKNKIQ